MSCDETQGCAPFGPPGGACFSVMHNRNKRRVMGSAGA